MFRINAPRLARHCIPDVFRFVQGRKRFPRRVNRMVWRAGNTPSPSCSRMRVTPLRSMASGISAPRSASCPTIRATMNGGGSMKGRTGCRLYQHPAIRPRGRRDTSCLAGRERQEVKEGKSFRPGSQELTRPGNNRKNDCVYRKKCKTKEAFF